MKYVGASLAVCLMAATIIAIILSSKAEAVPVLSISEQVPAHDASMTPVEVANRFLAARNAHSKGEKVDSTVCVPCQERKTEPAQSEQRTNRPLPLMADTEDSPFFKVTGRKADFESPALVGICRIRSAWPTSGTLLLMAGEPMAEVRGKFRITSEGMSLTITDGIAPPQQLLVDDSLSETALKTPTMTWAARVLWKDLCAYSTSLHGDIITGQIAGGLLVQSATSTQCLLRNPTLEMQPQRFDDCELQIDKQGRIISVQDDVVEFSTDVLLYLRKRTDSDR